MKSLYRSNPHCGAIQVNPHCGAIQVNPQNFGGTLEDFGTSLDRVLLPAFMTTMAFAFVESVVKGDKFQEVIENNPKGYGLIFAISTGSSFYHLNRMNKL